MIDRYCALKNIIVVGDSFASDPNGWPGVLANNLNLNLLCHGQGGQPWWNVRNFITKLSVDIVENAEFIVFAHTNAERIPGSNEQLGRIDHSKSPQSEIETAIHLYYKYIHEHNFLTWAQQQWFIEISRIWGHKKLCHLHCFPGSLNHSNLLPGVNITTDLMSLSLNELGTTNIWGLVDDKRSNHFNQNNNMQLGLQIAEQLQDYGNKSVGLDVAKFDQRSNHK